jgi:subtilisin family serine protease
LLISGCSTAPDEGAPKSTTPVANAGSDQNIQLGATVYLDASKSTDESTTLLNYTWAITSKPFNSQTTLNNTSSISPSFIPDIPGTYRISLVVHNSSHSSLSDDIIITVTTINTRPIADAGETQNIFLESPVLLNGSNSSDAENDTLTYSWSFISRPAQSTATIVDSSLQKPIFTPDLIGIYILSLTVSDKELTSLSARVTIYVTKKPASIKEDDPLSIFQWHLNSTQEAITTYAQTIISSSQTISTLATPNIDIKNNQTSYQGAGIKIGIIDTGIESTHPDLADNLDTTLSIRYSDNSNDPSPTAGQLSSTPTISAHGTCCAGIAAAVSDNGIGVKGVASKATLVGINAFSSPTAVNFVKAIQHNNNTIDIYSNSWGDTPGGITDGEVEAIKTSAINGRGGKGSIFVFAAGNEHTDGANANYFAELNSKYVLTMGALTATGHVATYSNHGANVIASSFGGGTDSNDFTIVTTDLTGDTYGYDKANDHFESSDNSNSDYTYAMNGTSAACPMTAGIIALMLEANPTLTLRDIRYIFAHTATQYNLGSIDSEAIKNGAGLLYSHKSGFGGIDSDTAVAMAKSFTPLSSEIVEPYLPSQAQETITIDAGEQKTSTISIPYNMKIEFVDIYLKLFHTSPGELEITLTSPSGMHSILSPKNSLLTFSKRSIFENFRFGSVAHFDEESQGEWILSIKNHSSSRDAILTKFQIQINGRAL